MDTTKFVAVAILLSLGLGIIAAIVEENGTALSQNLYMFAGLGFYIFGFWGAIKLLGNK